MSKKIAREFGKKEKILNYTAQTYQLTRPNKVGTVMELIRECQPNSLQSWEDYYFARAFSKNKDAIRITHKVLEELGERLYAKITEIVMPEWLEAFQSLTEQDCKDYIYEVTLVRTYDGFMTEKSVVHDNLARKLPDIRFEESDACLDHAGDIDYLGWVNEQKAIGLQIKPVTASANFANYNISTRMQKNFQTFEENYGGKVFIVFSIRDGNKKHIYNEDALISDIKEEVTRLSSRF